jgi:hypothetical protein
LRDWTFREAFISAHFSRLQLLANFTVGTDSILTALVNGLLLDDLHGLRIVTSARAGARLSPTANDSSEGRHRIFFEAGPCFWGLLETHNLLQTARTQSSMELYTGFQLGAFLSMHLSNLTVTFVSRPFAVGRHWTGNGVDAAISRLPCRTTSSPRSSTTMKSKTCRSSASWLPALPGGSVLLLLSACEPPNQPEIVAHRALGFTEGGEENQPHNVLLAFQNGFGAEIDLRTDGEGCAEGEDPGETGCFDMGHSKPNGHRFSEVIAQLAEGWEAGFDHHTLVIDIANDSDNLVSTNLMEYLFRALPANGLETLKLLVQSSAFEDLEVLRFAYDQYLDGGGAPLDLRIAITYFANPELPLPEYVDAMVCNISELPSLPEVPQEVAVFGVDSWGGWKQALFSSSRVTMVITDYPYRFAEDEP